MKSLRQYRLRIVDGGDEIAERLCENILSWITAMGMVFAGTVGSGRSPCTAPLAPVRE